jgi:hypothetical protein
MILFLAFSTVFLLAAPLGGIFFNDLSFLKAGHKLVGCVFTPLVKPDSKPSGFLTRSPRMGDSEKGRLGNFLKEVDQLNKCLKVYRKVIRTLILLRTGTPHNYSKETGKRN